MLLHHRPCPLMHEPARCTMLMPSYISPAEGIRLHAPCLHELHVQQQPTMQHVSPPSKVAPGLTHGMRPPSTVEQG
jgi:hypothetical protein